MLLGNFLGRPRADVTWHPLDTRWYNPLSPLDASGLVVSPDTITRCGTVLAAVRFKANAMAMATPVKLYRRVDDRRREEAGDHYAARLLRRPNAAMTAARWMRLQEFNVTIYGNAYNRIVPGPDSFAGALWPIPPTRIKAAPSDTDGTVRYEYQPEEPGSAPKILSQDEVLHFRGLSADGYEGLEMYRLIQRSVGVAIAAEQHAESFMRQGTNLSGIVSFKDTTTGDTIERAEKSWTRKYGGAKKAGLVAFMGGEAKFSPMAANHQDAQFMELRDFQVQEILRFLGVPGVVVGYQGDKASTYASAETFFEKGGLKHTIQPEMTDFQQELAFALLLGDDDHYFRFNMRGLERINTKERFESHQRAIQSGWKTPNEVRAEEDMNPGGPELDDHWRPVNVTAADEPPSTKEGEPSSLPMPSNTAPPARDDDQDEDEGDEAQAALARTFALDIAERLIRKEQRAVRTRLAKVRDGRADDVEHFARWSVDYYEKHADALAEQLRITPEQAGEFAAEQRRELLERGEAAVEQWDQKAPRLAALALGEA